MSAPGAGLDHVALLDVVAHVQDDGDAVADDARAALQLGNVGDHLARGRIVGGLGDIDLADQRLDDVGGGQTRAVGGSQRRAVSALEVIVQDVFVGVPG